MIGCAPTTRPLLTVIPFARSDYALALELLGWMRELGGCGEHRCLLVAANHISAEELRVARVAAEGSFAVVETLQPPHPLPDESWPKGANWLFTTTARHVESQRLGAWWWHEPDCIPLCPGWLDIMEEEYWQCRKPFMGVWVRGIAMENRTVAPSFNGCAIYPEDTNTRFRNLDLVNGEAWDIATGPITVPNGHNAASIGHFWGTLGNPPTFREFHAKGEPENVLTLENIPKRAVVFHRVKDGSLIRLLRKSETTQSLSAANVYFGDPRRSPQPRVIHVVERHESGEPRLDRAEASWKALYDAHAMEGVHVWKYPRSSESMGDKRGLPYLKDLLSAGMERASDTDIVALSNGDNLLHADLPRLLRATLAKVPCICSYRLNVFEPPNMARTPQALAALGKPDFGRDLFAFRKSWLTQRWSQIPDFFVGEWEWDLVMAMWIRIENGVPIIAKTALHSGHPQSDLPLGYVLHEFHDRPWLHDANKNSPAKRHNRILANQWYHEHGLDSYFVP